MPGSTIYKRETSGEHPTYPPHTTTTNKGNQHGSGRHTTYHVHQLNRGVPCCIKPRQPVHNGPVWNQWQPDPRYKHLMQLLRSCGIMIEKHILDNEASGDYLQAIKKHAQEKCSWKSNKHLQKSFQGNLGRSWSNISNAPLGLPPAASRKHIKHDVANKHCTKDVRIHLSVWTAQLQQNANGPHGMHSLNPCQTWHQKNMGQQCNWWILPGNITRTLQVLQGVGQTNTKHTSDGQGLFQTPIHQKC